MKSWLNDISGFWETARPAFQSKEAQCSLFLGLVHRFQFKHDDCLALGSLGHGQGLSALLVSKYRSNVNLVPTPTTDPITIRDLLEGVNARALGCNGLVADSETAEIYRSVLEEFGASLFPHMRQGIYKCSKVVQPDAPRGFKFRKALERDLDTIANWCEVFQQEAVPHDPEVNGYEFAKPKIAAGDIFVGTVNDMVVAMVAKSRDIGTSCSVNMVYTPPGMRGRGHGSLVTAHLTQLLLEEGKRETNLYTDWDNPTSNKIYQNIGYEFVGRSVHYNVCWPA